MDKITFREAQLMVIGAELLKGKEISKYVALNSLQKFKIGDVVEVVEIRLDSDCIVVQTAEGPQSYICVDNLADRVVDECIDILREVAYFIDEYNEHL